MKRTTNISKFTEDITINMHLWLINNQHKQILGKFILILSFKNFKMCI